MCAWAVVAGAAISVVGGALLSDDHGAGDANAAAGDATRTQSAIAQDQWDTYKQIYQPLEKSYAADAQTYASAANRERYAGQAQASVAQQYGLAHERLARTPGLDTSSPAYAASLVGLDMHQAAASATGQNTARYRVDDMGWARRTDALSLGKGLPAQASAGLAQAAATNNQRAQNGFAAANTQGAQIGQLVSQGINAYNKSQTPGLSPFRQDPTVPTDAGGNLQFDP